MLHDKNDENDQLSKAIDDYQSDLMSYNEKLET